MFWSPMLQSSDIRWDSEEATGCWNGVGLLHPFYGPPARSPADDHVRRPRHLCDVAVCSACLLAVAHLPGWFVWCGCELGRLVHTGRVTHYCWVWVCVVFGWSLCTGACDSLPLVTV
ncbi:unnamed protein product [Vitrella brassicaformis CCMP3155]|uniref:Uncharacterized protein n=1 Tax=Vitrella brassicaformis (strain CCMP3155) TaxID=1169540 RepID=A0A0G4FSB0_VITBC|nr:unnamed protein product [Vitrella brassicaformis CCMP3155]|eukprot:CEM17574.1 unnamed protein product [Vitrella brassicaformis CCMP3155]